MECPSCIPFFHSCIPAFLHSCILVISPAKPSPDPARCLRCEPTTTSCDTPRAPTARRARPRRARLLTSASCPRDARRQTPSRPVASTRRPAGPVRVHAADGRRCCGGGRGLRGGRRRGSRASQLHGQRLRLCSRNREAPLLAGESVTSHLYTMRAGCKIPDGQWRTAVVLPIDQHGCASRRRLDDNAAGDDRRGDRLSRCAHQVSQSAPPAREQVSQPAPPARVGPPLKRRPAAVDTPRAASAFSALAASGLTSGTATACVGCDRPRATPHPDTVAGRKANSHADRQRDGERPVAGKGRLGSGQRHARHHRWQLALPEDRLRFKRQPQFGVGCRAAIHSGLETINR